MTTANPGSVHCGRLAVDDLVVQSLMIAFAMVMLDELVHRFPEVPFPQRNRPIQTLVARQNESAPFCAFGFRAVRTAPRSPWQNPYVERVIGSIRRECLDHVIVFNERHLLRVVRAYVTYYHRSRTHLALDKDTPLRRAIDDADAGRIVARPEVGGLHHRYERQAA